jgi:hypothetical protein
MTKKISKNAARPKQAMTVELVEKGRPTRVIAPPESTKIGRFHCLLFSCNDGCIYTQAELAALPHINIMPSTIYARMQKHGWQYPGLLKPGNGQRKKKEDRVRREAPGNLKPPPVLVNATPRRFCPITSNMEMKSTRPGFFRSCEAFQHMFVPRTRDLVHPYCGICKGELLPDRLIFIDMEGNRRA